jgi:2-iminobutanoate/2-iminopropanoate deaminase
MLFLSGAVPIDRATGDTVGESIEEQTSQTIDNLAAILGEAGGTLDDVVKSTVFLTDSTLAAGMNSVYSQRFTAPYPARSTVQVGPLARVEFLIEIEAIAILDDDR